jgi:hypothetical protein
MIVMNRTKMKERAMTTPQVEVKRGRVRGAAYRARTTMVPWSGRVHVDVTPEPELVAVQSTPRFGRAKERLAPRVQIAREKYVPAAELAALRTRQAVREELVPQVTAAVTAAMAASEPYRREAQRRSVAAAAALRGADVEVHEPEPETHRIRTLLVTLGLGGIAAAAYKWFTGKEADSSWEQAYQPASVQPTDSATVPPPTTDPGAAAPDEVLADSGEMPHQATTIDSPLEEQILDPTAGSDPDLPSDGQRTT